ncbi:hypothetical protein FA95DRAFT_1491458 [Auriscalpium vulgare]|uniref:Uncharacterized protein n=1 Tax=Auriscalpium vulgare TaxID=40419 RepID=A0ACB8RWC0_9AGAM|nr:hypothetical protein FA95DRAFT_1491458 [Auriscalpium vulgare]
MDRPSTSKPRGLCRYYNTPHGCFQRNNCKFLHGTEEKLTPYDKSKVCRFFAAGYCKRGEKCWFQHVLPDATTAPSPQSVPPPIAPEDAMCGICYEVPVTYGLLSDCGHIFCVECLRSWRDKKNKSDDVSFLNKKCPYCRTTSKLVIPSSHYYPHGHDGKAATLQKYKDSLSRVPCKYFTRSKPNNRFCPFGRDCLYQHRNADGTEFVFSRGSKYNLRRSGLRNRVFPGGFMENFPWGGDQEIVHVCYLYPYLPSILSAELTTTWPSGTKRTTAQSSKSCE